MTDFKTVPLSEIHPDKNQPRKYYNEADMAELTQSIKEKGVLQPILIRPNDTGYILVCGERRYRGSIEAGLTEIPAVIRSLTDDEALELQIIENLQRKDVHPMEEAVAFKSLLERKEHAMTVEEIAGRIGKKPMFIRQRLKLNSLNKQWQDAFYKNLLGVTDAIKISALQHDQQGAIAKEYRLTEDIKAEKKINIESWRFKKYLGNLSTATFDLTDPTLSKKFGPCTTCPFNSAVSSLFPEDAKNPVCTNIPDFTLKTNVAFERKVAQAKEDPATVLVTNYSYTDDKELEPLKKAGHTVYTPRDYDSVRQPKKPDWLDFLEENEDENWTEERKQKEFDKEVAEYNKEQADFEKKISGGKYLKGLIVNEGRDKGNLIYLKLTPKSGSSKQTAEKEKSGALTAADIDSEIRRIEDREKRNKELDVNKVHKIILETLEKVKEVRTPGLKHQGAADRSIMVYLLFHKAAGHQAQQEISKQIKDFPKEPSYGAHGYATEYFAKLGDITDDQLALMIRLITINECGNSKIFGDVRKQDTSMLLIAQYAGIDINAIQKEQSDIAAKRIKKVGARIASLKEQKRQLAPGRKKAAKKK